MKSGASILTMVKDKMAHSLLSRALHRDKGRRPTATQIVSDGFFSADISRAQDLLQKLERGRKDWLQELEKGREELERKQANHSNAVHELQQHMADEEQRKGARGSRQAQPR